MPGAEDGAGPRPEGSSLSRDLLGRIHRLDLAAYRAVAQTSTPRWDAHLQRLSEAANYSRLSLTAAGAIAVAGGARGRRAAVSGVASLLVASATVNIAAKLLTRRRRPDRAGVGVVRARHVPMPGSSSFPSGHSAAAFAFAAGVGHEWPVVALPLHALAAVVAYSRVHTGVHYPGDVLVGSAIGLGSAALTTRALDRRAARTGRRSASW